MPAQNASACTCSACSAVKIKLGTTNCLSGDSEKAPPRPRYCPTNAVPDAIGGGLLELRGGGADARVARVAARVEGLGYERAAARWTRIEDTIAFAKLMGFRRIGIATCIGLLEETNQLVSILEAQGFQAESVCCKAGSTDKCELGVRDGEKIRPGQFEAACNPIGQARACNEMGTELNVIMGLCVGHDALFAKHSKALVTTLVAKDRVTGHNPVAPLHGRHYYARLRKPLPVRGETEA